ncbi:MAG TPA: 4a-hydroxytetrahydrobiopterin dehydratase [Polyangiaceae bacterium]|nr:4a-hydroxytetrahydrobiopterin dehydratase [Polyangiaceae bacterium]
MSLAQKKCTACTSETPKLTAGEIGLLLPELGDWRVASGKLEKTFVFKDFVTAIEFLNRVAEVAEGEQHHPDFSVHYNRVEFTIFTHAVGGLSENDFILAAKINALV